MVILIAERSIRGDRCHCLFIYISVEALHQLIGDLGPEGFPTNENTYSSFYNASDDF